MTLISIAEVKQMFRIESTVALCHRLRDGTIPLPVKGWGPPRWNREEVAQAVASSNEAPTEGN